MIESPELAGELRKDGNEIVGSWQLTVAAENCIECSGVDSWQVGLRKSL
jgi:hypothetical protein